MRNRTIWAVVALVTVLTILGFVLYASNNKPYVVTNRHVVKEAETVDVEFENEDGSNSSYKELKIIAADKDIDIAHGTYTSGRKCISIFTMPSPEHASHLPPLTLN